MSTESPEQRRANIKQMFDAISPRYDLLNFLLSGGRDRSWRRRGIRALDPQPGHRLLDLACGTGDVALTAWRRQRKLGDIIGVDFSENMLKLAGPKFARARVDVPHTFVAGDATALPLADASVDLVTIAFGIRNVVDVPAALRDMRRVLRPGGRCLILEFSPPRGRFFGPLFQWYFHRVLPFIGGIISGRRSAYEYLPRSVSSFYAPEELCRLIRESGFADVRSERYTFGVVYAYYGSVSDPRKQGYN